MDDQQVDSRDFYLLNPKTGEIIGLHEVGYDNSEWDLVGLDGVVTRQKGFQAFERWGNPYNQFFKFLGNSFRVHQDCQQVFMEFINDGWVDLDAEKIKAFQNATVDLLMHKYAYFELNKPLISNAEYDAREREWESMGRELNIPMEEYPNWIGWDQHHHLAYYAKRKYEEKVNGKVQ